MNKRPHPGGLGLPAKPYSPSQAGHAPPLPAGPPPQQPQYTQDQQAAHAAAWAAYYQSQGAASGGGGGGGYAAPAGGDASSAPNPYANYGYGAGASHAQNYNQQPGGGGGGGGHGGGHGGAGGYAAGGNQNNYGQQGYNYQGYGAQGYGAPATPQPPPPAAAGGGGAYGGWGAGGGHQSPSPVNPTAGGYTPQHTPQAQAYYPPQGGQAPQNQYRPPGGNPNRPYQPQPGAGRSPARPPPGGGPGGPAGPGGFPPAKRPRFDGPGGGGGGGGSGGGGMPQRPPGPRPPPAYGSGMARPMNDRGGGGAGDRGGHGGRGGGPGNNTSIPRIGFGGPSQRGPQRGGMRGGGGPMGGRGGGMMGRGPPMRQRDQRDMRPPRRERDRGGGGDRGAGVDASPQQARKRKDKDAKEARTTMTDFRIVGIEVKELGWSWGLVGEHVVEKDEAKPEITDEPKGVAEEAKPAESAEGGAEDNKPEVGEAVKGEKTDETEVKAEADEVKPEASAAADATADAPAAEGEPPKAEPEEAHDEKRGEKRKAKPSSGDDDEAQSPKKRTFILTHNKVNTPGEGPSPESNQNRFRIYFESPPELDRVPKAARRNPNKRWRRESTTLEETVREEPHEEAAQESAADKSEAAAGTETKEETVPADAETNGDKAVEEVTEAPAEPKAETAEASAEAPGTASAEPSAETAEIKEDTKEATKDEPKEEAGDVSMVTDPGSVAEAVAEAEEPHGGLTGAEASAAEMEAALAESAQNAASAYGTRNQKTRGRRWSTSSIGSETESVMTGHAGDVTQPSVNRVSVLYEDSSRRLVFDASVVQKIRIFRSEGRIEVDLHPPTPPAPKEEAKQGEDKKDDQKETHAELPKGVLVETYEPGEQRFVAVSREKLDQLWNGDEDKTFPPLHRIFGAASTHAEPITLTVYLNKKKPLSEPKWCRTNQADEWLYEQFGRRANSETGWHGKLEIMDPDAPPTLSNMLDVWKNGSNHGTLAERTEFTASLLASPSDLLEILLRLTRGDRNPTASIGTGPTSANGPLATAIRTDSPYASHQTHVSLAILAMYRLTTDYAQQAGVKTEVLNDQITDIIRSLPSHMIHKSLDGLYKEWLSERRQ